MNTDQIEGKWKQFSGSFREKFGKFTNDDVAQFSGKRDQLIGQIQEKYGDSKEEAERRYNEWANTLDDDRITRTSAMGSNRL